METLSNSFILGRFEYCLNVVDLARSLEFYKKLGFIEKGGDKEDGWVILQHSNLTLALYQGHIPGNVLNFRGADIYKIAQELKARGVVFSEDAREEEDGSVGALLEDPDGNIIYFNTFPGEEI